MGRMKEELLGLQEDLDRIDELEHANEIRSRLENIEDKISRLESDRQATVEDLESLKALVDKTRTLGATEENKEALQKLRAREKKSLEIENKIKELLLERETLRRELPGAIIFDKFRVLKNIRNLLKISEVKLGQIERDAGCTIGYMSRLEKEGNTTSPSIEFIVAASKALGVSVNTILFGVIDDISSTELYLIQFLSRLLTQTIQGKIHWNIENLENKPEYSGLMRQSFIVDDGIVLDEDGWVFDSLFYPDDYIVPINNTYSAQIPDENYSIYLANVQLIKDELNIENFFEVYFIGDESGKQKVFDTRYASLSLRKSVEELKGVADKSSKEIFIDNTAKDMIEKFMRNN